MKTFKTPVVTLLLLAFAALLGGCSMHSQKNTSIPWSRPANWEGQIPGMGTTPGSGAR
jgi:outer membrane lipopolysaccharide assembly protein LptE/RlpB